MPTPMPSSPLHRCQQHALRQKLDKDSPWSRSQRTAYRHLFLTCHALGEQEIGNIDASDQQDKAHCPQQKPECQLSSLGRKSFLSGSTKDPQPLLLFG